MDSSAALPSPPLSRVVVSGGTHGNELAGVCLVKEWLRGDSAPCLERSSFTAQPLLANPRATEQGVRYCFEIQESFDYPRDEEGILTACIHPDRQTLDFGVTVPYGGPEEPLYPVFINEAAYYSKGIAFWGAREVTVQLPAIGVPL
ncbi:N-acyl-aromatic-L-amino acid amidohydrolase (carboxylate-forming) [Acipenser ruthenus]|uniref:N-acyl-aromatic-L-amino acid amidohydrolase (Carboxylate-forming) n=1 Tax=Acipenser ruthenus TaxID=7906 RepID=A0A444URC2_ACIRT|nr:N-acyl-aromatic-L-amino acid amidohydrolase (carboxylate-forming) [Acipenser ruthenus]